ncbi:hypothetical protein AJ80_07202 [Polytolypa hystricis UAMH7299]|uniref:Uncharacterized protein n=1 Tax=Polytolypa hystricis (strain UAMH7299) TaxID=1447883 RepID=A0A2B7XRP3_POLH7|nr:hypothetical protein AJ80_07202 [Polytolypa hystricis UAMH7299]
MDPDYKAKYAIHEATREGQVSLVESLLNANPKLALLKDPDERLAIHWAVAYNRLPIFELLVAVKDFDPDATDASGWTPLMMAASLRDSEGDAMIEMLLRKDGDPNMKSVTGQNALHFATSKGNLSTVKILLGAKCSARAVDSRGQLPLHRAAATGSVPIMKVLLDEGKSPLNTADVDGMTPLHHAVSEGHAEAAVLLLRLGADAGKRDKGGKLAIEMAPDSKVRKYILQAAEREGIRLP